MAEETREETIDRANAIVDELVGGGAVSYVHTDVPINNGQWSINNGQWSASAEIITKAGLIKKLARIAGKVGYVAKGGYNERQNYKFAQAGDIYMEVKPLLAEEGVHLHATMEPDSWSHVEAGKTSSGTTNWLDKMVIRVTATDGATGASIHVLVPTVALDTGDKGPNKCMTAGQKYGEVMLFQIATGDDPEVANEAADGHAGRGGPSTPPRPNRPAQAPPASAKPQAAQEAPKTQQGRAPLTREEPKKVLFDPETGEVARLGAKAVLKVARKTFSWTDSGPNEKGEVYTDELDDLVDNFPLEKARSLEAYLFKMTA